MAELAYVKLGDDAVATELKDLSEWSVVEEMLTKSFSFESYLAGVEFTAKVGAAAESLDHHPDIHLYWRRVIIAMNTHAVGGLSPYDFELARQIDALI